MGFGSRGPRKFSCRSSRKTLGNNDLNQVVASSSFSENKGLGGGSVSRAHKTWSRSFLFKDFRSSRIPKCIDREGLERRRIGTRQTLAYI